MGGRKVVLRHRAKVRWDNVVKSRQKTADRQKGGFGLDAERDVLKGGIGCAFQPATTLQMVMPKTVRTLCEEVLKKRWLNWPADPASSSFAGLWRISSASARASAFVKATADMLTYHHHKGKKDRQEIRRLGKWGIGENRTGSRPRTEAPCDLIRGPPHSSSGGRRYVALLYSRQLVPRV